MVYHQLGARGARACGRGVGKRRVLSILALTFSSEGDLPVEHGDELLGRHLVFGRQLVLIRLRGIPQARA